MAEKVEIIIEAEDKASKVISGIGTKLGGIAKIAGGIALGGLAIAGGALVGLGASVTEFVKEATASQTVAARMQAQLAALGDTANITAPDINKLADEISKMTGFDDEALVAGQTTLLRFGNLSKEQFETATKAAADLAAMTGMDLTSAFQQVGRALEDPQTGFGRLKRQIGDMTDEQKEAIKAALKMGDTAKAQGIILDALAGKVKGAGKAMGQTFKGQMDRLRLTLGNLKEDLGAALLPTIQLFADKLLSVVQSDKFQDWIAKVADWLQNKLPLAIQAASAFWTTRLQPALSAVWEFISTKLVPAFQVIWDWLSSKLKPAIDDLSSFWRDTLLPILSDTYNWFMTELPAAVQKYMDELELLGETFTAIKDVMALFKVDAQSSSNEVSISFKSIADAIGAVASKVVGTFNFIVTQVNLFLTTITNSLNIVKSLFSGSFSEILISLAVFGQNLSIGVTNLVKSFLSIFMDTSWWPDLKPMGREMVAGMIAGWTEVWNSFWSKVSETLTGFINSVKALFGIASPSTVFIGIGLSIMMGLASGITTGLRLVITAIAAVGVALKTAFTMIVNAIKGLPWSSIGTSIINGIIAGIRNGLSSLTTAAKNAAMDAYNAAKAALGISSPSKMFASMGEMIPAGMAQGINKSAGIAIAALEDMVGSMSTIKFQAMTPAPAMATNGTTAPMLPEIPMNGIRGGNNWTINVNYSPTVSTGSRAEFEAQFVPLVDQAMRRVNRGKV